MSEQEEDLDQFCSQLVRTYLSIPPGQDVSIEERGGGSGNKDAKKEATPTATTDHQNLAHSLLEYQPTQTSIIPQQLPESLRNSPEAIQPDHLLNLYDIDTSMEQVEAGNLSTLDVVVLHLKSYRNILEIQLSDVSQLRQRFIGYFTSVFTQLMDRCYQDRNDSIALQMWTDLRRQQEGQRQQGHSSRT